MASGESLYRASAKRRGVGRKLVEPRQLVTILCVAGQLLPPLTSLHFPLDGRQVEPSTSVLGGKLREGAADSSYLHTHTHTHTQLQLVARKAHCARCGGGGRNQ